jgi:hypothetical protein
MTVVKSERKSMKTLTGSVMLLIVVLGASRAPAQDFEDFWRQVQVAVEADNFQSLKKLAELEPNNAEACFWRAVDHYVTLEIQGKIEESQKSRRIMEQIGNAFYVLKDDRDLTKYSQFIVRLNLMEKDLWSKAFGKYYDFMQAFYKADAPKEPVEEDVRKALELWEAPGQEMEGLNDFYIQGLIQKCVGVLYAKLGDADRSKRAFEISAACFTTFDSPKQLQEIDGYMAKVEQIKRAKEYEEEQRRKELEKEGIAQEGEIPWEKLELSYEVDPKGLAETAHPYTVDDYLLWYRVIVPETDPASFYESFENSAAMFTSYYKDVFGRWPSQSSLLFHYMFVQDGNKLTLDFNDDGRVQPNERLKVTSRPKVVEFDDLRTKDGQTFRYAMEMVDIGKETWFGQPNSSFANPGQKAIGYRRACHREGKYKDRTLILIDDNSNGCFADIGGDTLFLEGEDPCFLGKLMRLGDEICQVRVQDDLGNGINIRPWKGETGFIETSWKGKVEPGHLFIRGIDGEILNSVFRLDLRDPVEVPVGTYRFYFGVIRSGKARNVTSVEIREGRSSDIVVKAGETARFDLGAPFTMEFAVSEEPEMYMIRGKDLQYFGASGELYTRFYGEVPLPKITVRRDRGGIVEKGSMRKVELEDRYRDPNNVWYPKDFEIDKAKAGADAKFLAKFTVDSKLLGPVKTDYVEAKD